MENAVGAEVGKLVRRLLAPLELTRVLSVSRVTNRLVVSVSRVN